MMTVTTTVITAVVVARLTPPNWDRYAEDDDEFSDIDVYTRDLRICTWTRNFKPVGIDKYDSKTELK